MKSTITLVNPYNQSPLQKTAEGLLQSLKNVFPYKNGAYRIVQDDNYTQNFGYQWNSFVGTQIDKTSNLDLSKQRFFVETGWDKEDLTNQNILEVGSGAGRFSQIVLDHTNANLYSVDYSNAVEANFKNNGPSERLQLFQASIYEMPFAKAQFDKVFCLGVLQHTPDVKKSVQCLLEMAKTGAEVVVDFYAVNGWWTKLHSKYIFRPFTKNMTHEKLLKLIEKNVDWMIKAQQFFTKIKLGKIVNRFIPLCDISGTLPKGLSKAQLREMCILDTFDMFSPQYDQPQKVSTVVKWFKENSMENVWGGPIHYDNYTAYVVKGIKK
jgi:ubiquinone/menaquinone biosynthesis C-methylase UbiE